MPYFNQTFAFEGMQPDVKQEIEIARARAEVGEAEARTQKLVNEINAINASATKDTESIRQTDERIKIERAKVVNDRQVKDRTIDSKQQTETDKLKVAESKTPPKTGSK
jgi:hypothetical protein